MKSILINMNDQGQIEVTPQDCNLEDMMNIMPLASLAIMRSALAQTPTDDQAKMKEFLYEVYNTSASNVLDLFAPDLLPNHEMTPEQMLAQENKLIDELFHHANRKTKRKHKRNL
jgi:deoxyribodipyrimidine photolyase-like uncharacterized protein